MLSESSGSRPLSCQKSVSSVPALEDYVEISFQSASGVIPDLQASTLQRAKSAGEDDPEEFAAMITSANH